MNHTIFNVATILVTIVLLAFVVKSGEVEVKTILNLITGIMMNVALFLGITFGLQYFQMSIGRDISKEIFDEHNVAAAIFQGFLALSIALVISKGLM